MAGDPRQTCGVILHFGDIAVLPVLGDGFAENGLHPNRPTPPAQRALRPAATAEARTAHIFVVKRDAFEVARQIICAERGVRPAAIFAQQAAHQHIVLHTGIVPRQRKAFVRRAACHAGIGRGRGTRRGGRWCGQLRQITRRQCHQRQSDGAGSQNPWKSGKSGGDSHSSLNPVPQFRRCRPIRRVWPWPMPEYRAIQPPFFAVRFRRPRVWPCLHPQWQGFR